MQWIPMNGLHRWHCLLGWALLAAALFQPATVVAQRLVVSDAKPRNPAPNTWWWSPSHREVKQFFDGKWRFGHSPDERVHSARTYHDVLILKMIDHYRVMDFDGYAIVVNCDTVIAHDSLLLTRSRFTDVLIDTRHNQELKDRRRNLTTVTANLEPQQVDGRTGFCILDNLANVPQTASRGDLNFWGLLGSDGEWIIPPIYDGPFVFRDGVADVLYYGRRLRIDSRGAEVK